MSRPNMKDFIRSRWWVLSVLYSSFFEGMLSGERGERSVKGEEKMFVLACSGEWLSSSPTLSSS